MTALTVHRPVFGFVSPIPGADILDGSGKKRIIDGTFEAYPLNPGELSG